MKDPRWLAIARSYIGTREIKGPKHNNLILKMWERIKAPFRNDETPWCAAFVGSCLEEADLRSSRSAAARSYQNFAVELGEPALGCIVVFWRGSKNGYSGHVGFVVGKDRWGHLMVLGGNQSDAVNIKPFGTDRVLSYRWPSIWPLEERFNLPVLTSDGKLSTNEA